MVIIISNGVEDSTEGYLNDLGQTWIRLQMFGVWGLDFCDWMALGFQRWIV